MLQKPKILVVDDNPANLAAMRILLKRLDCQVIEARSGNEALAFSISDNFALILLDVNMPEMDGYEVARWLKEEPATQNIPIIFVTAFYEDHEHLLRGYQSGAIDYIHKPVDDVILLSKTRIFLDLYNNRQLAERELSRSEAMRIALEAELIERKRIEEKLRLSALVFQNSSEGMTVTDANGAIISVNPAFSELTGYSAEEVIGKNPRILKSGMHDTAFYQIMWADLNSKGSWQGEIWNRRKDGHVYAEWLSINTIYNDDGTPQRRVALFFDITKQEHDAELIWQQANFDPLTGLSNRRMFHDRLSQYLKKSQRTSSSLALLYLDLDEFKSVNDTLGHDMGDMLLKEAARRLCSCVRETDMVSRLGGDEFTIIIGELEDYSNVERVASAVIEKLSEPFTLGNDIGHVSASIGITLYPDDAANIETLLKNADQAMYAAKNQGKKRFCYFTQAMQEATLMRLQIGNDLRQALVGQQFDLHYQPIVELATGAIHKAEALIRWRHPIRGMIRPDQFIPVAEETGIIVEIGDWVFCEAVRYVGRWRAVFDPSFQISINKSPVQFNNNNHSHDHWISYIQEKGLPGNSIVIEITEGLLMASGAGVADKLLAFGKAGIQVAIDDFGTGYSSLAYIKKFHIDYLKIDQSFTKNLAPDASDFALCEAIVVMAHKLGLKVIAEGVETAQQRDLLKLIGCDYGQGYLFSRPIAAEDFEKLLTEHGKGA